MAQVKDLVCAMTFEEIDAAATLEHGGKTYYFCSDSCLEEFEANAEDYIT